MRAVQQLLSAAGYVNVGTPDGRWGKTNTATDSHTAGALRTFLQRNGTPDQVNALTLEANDDLLLEMAREACLIIPLTGKKGMDGVKATHQWLKAQGFNYNEGAQRTPPEGNRALWGVLDHPEAVVQTRQGAFSHASPIELDCTTYVNLMLSVYLYGDAHTNYNAHLDSYVDDKHLCKDFYGLPLLTRGTEHFFLSDDRRGALREVAIRTAAQIAEATSTAPTSLYVIELGGAAQGRVSHMALLHQGTVYECTTQHPACVDSSLQDFVIRVFHSHARKLPLYVFGPG